MKTLEDIQDHMEMLENIGTIKKRGSPPVLDYERMAIILSASPKKHEEGKSFDKHFMEGFYNALGWVMETPKKEWEIKEAYKLVDDSIMEIMDMTGKKKGHKINMVKRHRLIGERNAYGFCLDWSTTPQSRR